MPYNHLREVVEANDRAGRYFFSTGAMEFFGTKLETDLIDGRYFVTSEQPPYGPRMFSVREALANGEIETVGEFASHADLDAALEAVNQARKEVTT